MIRPGYICPNCKRVGDVLVIMVFENDRVVEVKCENCKSNIKYTIKAEVVE